VAKVYEALTTTEKMRQMVNSEDAAGSSGEALNVHGHTEQKKSNLGSKGKGNQRGRSKSKGSSNELFCRYCKRKNHNIDNYWKLQNKEKRNDTSKPKGKTDGSAFVASDNSFNNGDVLITLVDVHLMIPFGYLILHVHIMSTLTELCLVLMNRCRMEVLFR
jgi:hypothetical protein